MDKPRVAMDATLGHSGCRQLLSTWGRRSWKICRKCYPAPAPLGSNNGGRRVRDSGPGIFTGKLGPETAFRKCVLGGWHGKLRSTGPNRPSRLANLRWRFAPPIHCAAGPDRLRLVSKADGKQNGHIVRTKLWNPFLKSFGG